MYQNYREGIIIIVRSIWVVVAVPWINMGKNKVREDIEHKIVVYMYILERNDADEYLN